MTLPSSDEKAKSVVCSSKMYEDDWRTCSEWIRDLRHVFKQKRL